MPVSPARTTPTRTSTTGRATPPMTVKTPKPGLTEVTLDFRAAAAAAMGKKEYIVGSTPYADIIFTRIDVPAGFELTNKNLPPYDVVIRPKKNGRSDLDIVVGNGRSSWDPRFRSGAGEGSIIEAGTTTHTFQDERGKTVGSLTITLDTVNDYQRLPPKPASAHSKPFREAWKKTWVARDQSFSFDTGLAAGTFTKVSVADLRAVKDGKKIEKEIEAGGGDLTTLVRQGTVVIAKDKASGSISVISYTEGEIEHSMYVFDKAGKAVGEWFVDADAKSRWIEY